MWCFKKSLRWKSDIWDCKGLFCDEKEVFLNGKIVLLTEKRCVKLQGYCSKGGRAALGYKMLVLVLKPQGGCLKGSGLLLGTKCLFRCWKLDVLSCLTIRSKKAPFAENMRCFIKKGCFSLRAELLKRRCFWLKKRFSLKRAALGWNGVFFVYRGCQL